MLNTLVLGGAEYGEWLIRFTGVIDETGSSIEFSWEKQPDGVEVDLLKRELGELGGDTWNHISSFSAQETTYTDNDIVSGTAYEYKLYRSGWQTSESDYQYPGAGYWVSGRDVPFEHDRGIILVFVDSTQSSYLSDELNQLDMDLTGDGWQVKRYDFPRHSDVDLAREFRDTVRAKYQEDPENTEAVLLIGHLPYIKSGSAAPDGHSAVEHATDQFAADIDGEWSDSDNDGIFDQNNVPVNGNDVYGTELQIGRVDLANMGAWERTETELLRDYLIKNHRYRNSITEVDHRVIWDNLAFDESPVEEIAAKSFVDDSCIVHGDFKVDGEDTAVTFQWGIDFSDWNGANYPDYKFRITFALNFGSHKQKWSKSNNPMRAILCMPKYGLGAFWGVRPNWYIHHMGMGRTIGYSHYRSLNGTYNEYNPNNDYGSSWYRAVWVNLMGDPTLRNFPVKPVQELGAGVTSGDVSLTWDAPEENNLLGYHVYRSQDSTGSPYQRLNSSIIQNTSYTDPDPGSGTFHYMVRAVKLEELKFGSYRNPSQGVFTKVDTDNTSTFVNTASPVNRIMMYEYAKRWVIDIPASKRIRVDILDISGRCVKKKVFSGSSAVEYTLNKSDFSSGLYIIRVSASGGVILSRRLSVIR
ncbi:MAG: T9SS type A sorting domain-containing protein [Chitinivibrionales bacterium]